MLNCIVSKPLVKSPVLVKVNEPKFSILEFKVKVVLTSKLDPNVKLLLLLFATIKTSNTLVVPGVVVSILSILVDPPENVSCAVAFPTINPLGLAAIELMAVFPEVKVKFPEVNVTLAKESVALDLVFPPNVTPPAPFKVKLDGYLIKVLLGRVIGEVFVNVTVPLDAKI